MSHYATLHRHPFLKLLLCAALATLLLSCTARPRLDEAAPRNMLPRTYSEECEISGWLVSEKLDGVRAYWDGHQLWSKNGKRFYPPPEFVQDLPDFALEGELWGGRNSFEQTAAIVQQWPAADDWLKLKFAIFDVSQAVGSFTVRIDKAETWLSAHPSPYAFVIEQRPVRDRAELLLELQRIQELGGEGLIVRNPDALYAAGRSNEILKVKAFQDAEGVVIEHLPGQGQYLGQLGALLVERPDGTRFKLGSGFNATERKTPPTVGTMITYKFYGLYPSGLPKFPSYLRIRSDQNL